VFNDTYVYWEGSLSSVSFASWQ